MQRPHNRSILWRIVLLWLGLCEAFPIAPKSSSRQSTRRFVSELHIPAYRTSKLPFLPDSATHIQPRTYQAGRDYTSYLIQNHGGGLVHQTNFPLFSDAECHTIVQEAEAVARQRDWTRTRHGNFPTTDLPLTELPQTLHLLKEAWVERLQPLLADQFRHVLPDPSRLRIADGFVVKYDASEQRELKPHRDGAVVSFNIALNPSSDYVGGGTWFEALDAPIVLPQGHVVSHASGLLHGGQAITAGRRYILVAFCIVEGYDTWSMRFYNQVRNASGDDSS
ncbi:lysyl hydroxylase/galactosyltransferase/ glucosyltransferase [Fistulifera solaris]|uniref:Lysyl hydroxylase/galactosyltransferase/ glucosyltransferase n=1 Tax=Fistulifera solaris TaxID=1519565 RepID=A0A1Z5JMG5_FISSO|nr:lysyl hydroxylase/galactosyltransferase/ glucosyltransferase [Fistulifera solaris]|eukprot:GAX15195.1 lysyl hydroxylase/galactosyltransferase/ glucosyltransferase [Fistulifera solaris]